MINSIKQSFCSCWSSCSDSNSDYALVNTRAKVSEHDSSQEAVSKTRPISSFRCRNVSKIEKQNTSIISLDLSQKSTTQFEEAQLISVNFHIDGKTFTSINGNLRDEELSENTKKLHEFSIKILDCEGNRCIHEPDKIFQKNLMRCINEGMVSFYKISVSPDKIHTLYKKTYREVFGDNFNIPTCMEFARYLKYDIDDRDRIDSHIQSCKLIDSIQDAPEFSDVAILAIKSTDIIHEFIHIAHGICLNKIGTGSIYFAQFNQLLEFYDLCSNNYRLVVLREKLS